MRKYGIEHFHIEEIEETDIPEEREKYWIEYYRSFKDGYNATMGGDGKKYIDYDLVIATYKKVKNQKLVAKILNISPDSVSNILHQSSEKIYTSQEVIVAQQGKIVEMYDKDNNLLNIFPSAAEAARYLINNKLSNCKMTTIRYHIIEVCNNKRKSAAGFKWRFQ